MMTPGAAPSGEGMDPHEAAIRFLLHFLANHTLRVFAYHRFALAALVAVVLLSSGY